MIVGLFAQQQYLEKKRTWTRKMVLITDGESPLEVDDDDLNGIIEKINQYNVDMTVMYVRFSCRTASQSQLKYLEGLILTMKSCLTRNRKRPRSRSEIFLLCHHRVAGY